MLSFKYGSCLLAFEVPPDFEHDMIQHDPCTVAVMYGVVPLTSVLHGRQLPYI